MRILSACLPNQFIPLGIQTRLQAADLKAGAVRPGSNAPDPVQIRRGEA